MFNYRTAFLLYLIASVHCLDCPETAPLHYGTVDTTECKVYYRCENAQLQYFVCPDGQLFNEELRECQPASIINCGDDDSVHHIMKRAIEEVHTIDIHLLREKLETSFRTIEPILKEIVTDIAPSIYKKFEETYLPAIREFERDVAPLFDAKIYPQLQKYNVFVKSVVGKLFDKAYRSYELSNSTHISIVSVSDVADEIYNEIKPILDTARHVAKKMMVDNEVYRDKREAMEDFESLAPQSNITASDDHNRHKRAAEEVHTIDIRKLKAIIEEAYETILPMVEEIFSEVAPSLYAKVAFTYLPKIKKLRDESMPFLSSKFYPKVEKYIRFAKDVAGRVFERAHKSYELSNSTHIAVVSISDIASDVYTELKPIMELGKFFSARLMNSRNRQNRGKREAPEEELVRSKRFVPNMIKPLLEPIVEGILNYFIGTLSGNAETIFNDVVMPILNDIIEDPESFYDAYKLYKIFSSSFLPVLDELLHAQEWDTPYGTVIKIPREEFDNAVQKFVTRIRPIINKFVIRYGPKVAHYVGDNIEVFVNVTDSLVFEGYTGASTLLEHIRIFAAKHGKLLDTSTDQHAHFYPYFEIIEDLIPVAAEAGQIYMQYQKRNPDSWVSRLIGENPNSWLQRYLKGSPVYAKPRATTAKPVRKYFTNFDRRMATPLPYL